MASDLGNISLDAIMGQMDPSMAGADESTTMPVDMESGDDEGADGDIFEQLAKFDPNKIADFFKMKGWLDADWKLPEGAVDGGEPVAEEAGAFGDMANPDEEAAAAPVPLTGVI